MQQLKHRFAFLAGLLLAVLASAVQAGQYSKVYIFGDSLSDQGNLASVTQPFPNPPFFGNRVSNGAVAVEVMAAMMGYTLEPSLHLVGPEQGTNYAVAGARSGTDEAIDLNTQVNAFLLNHGGVAPEDALYVVFIGGNDVRAARDEADFSAALDILGTAAAGVKANLSRLIGAGARHVMVINVPDIGAIPETRLKSEALGEPMLPLLATWKTMIFNRKLSRVVRQVEKDAGIDIVEADLFTLFGNILRDADAYGYTNTTEACFSSQAMNFNPGCNYGQNFDSYIFFDEIHPTKVTHLKAGRVLFGLAP